MREELKFACGSQEYILSDEHVCDRCVNAKIRLGNVFVAQLFANGVVRWTDPRTSNSQEVDLRPNKIPAPTPDKAIARCFDLEK